MCKCLHLQAGRVSLERKVSSRSLRRNTSVSSPMAERGMLLIRMENCAAEPLHFVDGLPQTTKGDARWHGFGVKSIRRIVQQHGGTLTMQAQDGMFRLVALLPLK